MNNKLLYIKYFSKITKDLLVALIATYLIILIPELILPGIVSSHFNPKYLLLLILFLGLVFSKFPTKAGKTENPKFQAISRNLINIILFLITVMLILSLYRMKIWEIVVVVAVSVPLLLKAKNILIEKKNKARQPDFFLRLIVKILSFYPFQGFFRAFFP